MWVLFLGSYLKKRPPPGNLIKAKMKSQRCFTDAQCVEKTSPMPPNFSGTCALTRERGLSLAQCARRDSLKRVYSWSMREFIQGKSLFLVHSVKKDLLVKESSDCTGAHIRARGLISAQSVWKAFPDTGIWKHTWRQCTRRLSPDLQERSFHVQIVTRTATQLLSLEIIRGLTPERGPTSALSVRKDLLCRGHLWDMNVSTLASHLTTARTVGRHLHSSGHWPHTCARTQERNHTAVHSAISPLWRQESCGGTPGFTPERSHTPAQTAGGTSPWQER